MSRLVQKILTSSPRSRLTEKGLDLASVHLLAITSAVVVEQSDVVLAL